LFSHRLFFSIGVECEGDNDEVFESIFIAAPEVAGLGNAAGETPLHLAVKKGYLRIVRNLSSRAPHLCRYLDKVGNLPVHIAVGETSQRNKDAPLITSALLANYPRGLVIPNGQGYLPVHLASTHGFAAGLRGILAINSGAVFDRAPQLNGQILPIEFALAGHRRIMDALGKLKSAARCDTSSAEGCATLTPNTSVHGIISGTPYDDDIQIDCFSDVSLSSPHTGVQSRDERELLDQKQGYEDCIEMLLISALYRRTVLCPRDEGHEDAASVPFFLPLHAAFAHRLELENWHHLLRMYKMLHSSDIDRDGRTLLHACADACDNEKCRYSDGELTKMIQQVHEMDSTCHTRPDFMGLLPIQLAVLNGASAEVIKTFAKCGPGSASTRFMPISM
jgi:Ankyrin repeat